MKKLIFLILVLVIGYSVYTVYSQKQTTSPKNTSSITIGSTTYQLEIADTDNKRSKGLSGHAPLESNQGMLFVYQTKNHHSFWMKDMLFPLDIIWIDDDTIVHIEENVPIPLTATYLPIYKPERSANKVLEINAGEVQKHGFAVGQKVSITLINSGQ